MAIELLKNIDPTRLGLWVPCGDETCRAENRYLLDVLAYQGPLAYVARLMPIITAQPWAFVVVHLPFGIDAEDGGLQSIDAWRQCQLRYPHLRHTAANLDQFIAAWSLVRSVTESPVIVYLGALAPGMPSQQQFVPTMVGLAAREAFAVINNAIAPLASAWFELAFDSAANLAELAWVSPILSTLTPRPWIERRPTVFTRWLSGYPLIGDLWRFNADDASGSRYAIPRKQLTGPRILGTLNKPADWEQARWSDPGPWLAGLVEKQLADDALARVAIQAWQAERAI
jgi:hypothetical protein